MNNQYLQINGQRLWQTLESSAEIGKIRETGLRRLALTSEDKEMRDLFVGWCQDAGCQVDYDHLGNIFVTRTGEDQSLNRVAFGSHLDTQFNGGRYDGILGVLSGLELIRTLNDNHIKTKRTIELVVWSNEEGARFTPPMGPASVFAGQLSDEKILECVDADDVSYREALEAIGYNGSKEVSNRSFDAYFELHIEQGPILDASDQDIGVVVEGYKSCGLKIDIFGETGHSGPTAMEDRKNALVGAGLLISAVNDIGWKYSSEDGKTTVPQIHCLPNLAGIIPEYCQLTVDFRHPEQSQADKMLAEIKQAMQTSAEKARVKMEVADSWFFGDSPFADECIQLIKQTAESMGHDYMDIQSQAGHDAYAIANVAPVGMIFTPCKSGISHNTNEEIELNRTLPGVNVFCNTVLARANR